MENNVNENTCVVDGRRDASTVDAISAAFVEREAGNLEMHLAPVKSHRSGPCSLGTDLAPVIKEKNIDAHEPTAHRPYRIAGRGFRQ